MSTTANGTVRVLVVDDEELFRLGITQMVEVADDLTVVGSASDGRAAIEQAAAHRPDVVLMDIQMPELDGVAAAAEILRARPETAVVLLTSFLYDEYLLPALRAGVSGYLLKDSSPDELRRGIRAAADGDAVLSPAVTRRLLDSVGPGLDPRHARAVRAVGALSDREREIVALLADGLSNAEIARRTFLAETTVKTYLTRAMDKLGVANRTQAAILAVEAGIA